MKKKASFSELIKFLASYRKKKKTHRNRPMKYHDHHRHSGGENTLISCQDSNPASPRNQSFNIELSLHLT